MKVTVPAAHTRLARLPPLEASIVFCSSTIPIPSACTLLPTLIRIEPSSPRKTPSPIRM